MASNAGKSTRKSFREPKKEHPPIHTCIRRLTEQRGMGFDPADVRKKTDPETDENWFRKVSKYDMDMLNVDWDELLKEK